MNFKNVKIMESADYKKIDVKMFCYQCQEAAKGYGCTIKGICGKTDDVSNMHDLLIFVTKGVAIWAQLAKEKGIKLEKVNEFIMDALFATITNANFDYYAIIEKVKNGLRLREEIKRKYIDTGNLIPLDLHSCATWYADTVEEFERKAKLVGILSIENEDIRSLKELLLYGLKGMAAYAQHAYRLGYSDESIFSFMLKALVATTIEKSVDELISLVMECGEYGVKVMALLDKAHNESFGHPEITEVNIGVRNRPGILISGHDLKDLEELLEQSKNVGIDIYTHSEMLPGHYYPAFKKYNHFAGNYGNSWWKQKEEFESFNGPILFTTNCIVPPLENASYVDRIYTTGSAGLKGAKHIQDDKNGKTKDFSEIIEHAKKCKPPVEIEKGKIIGGFAHNQIVNLADKIVEAVKNRSIKKFFVMAGCDGRMLSREYYTEFAKKLPEDTVILTAGCAKYRYNKLNLGNINGIPRILDAGQCNDSYSLAVIALTLKDILKAKDINDLPIAYNIAWYEQKAVIVLLSLLYLGVKNIHLGPTLPAFLSPNVANVLVEKFGLSGITNVDDDLKKFLS